MSRKTLIQGILIGCLIWVSITCLIQRFFCDKLTETELFKRIPQSSQLDFIHCK